MTGNNMRSGDEVVYLDGRCSHCWHTDISYERTCHNSDCTAYATPETMFEGWRATTSSPLLDELVDALDDARNNGFGEEFFRIYVDALLARARAVLSASNAAPNAPTA